MLGLTGIARASLTVALSVATVSAQTVINDCVELQAITDPTASYMLANDIDCSDTKNWNGGAGFQPLSLSGGTFDGADHTITGLFINRPNTQNVGLFGHVGGGGVVRDLRLACVEVHGLARVGALAGGLGGSGAGLEGTISNVHVYSSIVTGGSGFGIGGLVGDYSQGSFDRCSSDATVTADATLGQSVNVGGLMGGSGTGGSIMDISDCFSTGTITAIAVGTNDTFHVGGLTGGAGGGGSVLNISRSYSSVSISGTIQRAGGLVGVMGAGTISDSFSTGDVSGVDDLGGLIGQVTTSSVITNCYWNDTPNNPSSCCSSGCITGCTAINEDESYFYSATNPPMDQWDFNTL